MRLIKNPSYKHPKELLGIFTKFSANIYQKDSTQYPKELFDTILYAIIEGKKYKLKQVHLLWLTKQIWELKLSQKIVREDYIPVIRSLINNQKLLYSINEYSNILELGIHINKILKTDESVPLEDLDIFFEKGGWITAMPKTIEASRKLGQDTVWCTARKNSNMFFTYLSEFKKNTILFYLIKLDGDSIKNPSDKLCIAFINGEPIFGEDSEGTTVDASNKEIDLDEFKKILGLKLSKEFLLEMSKKSQKLKGKHPLKIEIESIALSYEKYIEKINSLKENDRFLFNQKIVEFKLHPKIQKILLKSVDVYELRTLAENTSITFEIQKILAKNEDELVKIYLYLNQSVDPRIYKILIKDPDLEHLKKDLAKKPEIPSDVQRTFARDPDESIRSSLALNPNIGLEIQRILAKNASKAIKYNLLKNPNLFEEIKKMLIE